MTTPKVYPAGRLDYDSEGLVLLTSDGHLQSKISHPANKWPKTYLVQVEGSPSSSQLQQLRYGVALKDGLTKACEVQDLPKLCIAPRTPPIRERAQIPANWLMITLREGRNRQIRRMTAHVGLPTLRLIRIAIGQFTLLDLQPGQWRPVDTDQLNATLLDLKAQKRILAQLSFIN